MLQLSEEYIYALISFKCHLIHSSLNPSKVSLSQVKTINVARKEKPRQFRHEVRVWAIGQQTTVSECTYVADNLIKNIKIGI